MRASRPLLVCLMLLAASCGQSSDDRIASDQAIEGSVRDEFTRRAISGAKVTFVSDTLDRAETQSDADGRFSITVQVPDGVRFGTLRATRDGYGSSAERSVYFDGTTHNIDLVLRPRD